MRVWAPACVCVFKVELTMASRCRALVKYLLFKADSHNFLKLMSGAGYLDSGSGIELFVEFFHLTLVTCKSLRISLLALLSLSVSSSPELMGKWPCGFNPCNPRAVGRAFSTLNCICNGSLPLWSSFRRASVLQSSSIQLHCFSLLSYCPTFSLPRGRGIPVL